LARAQNQERGPQSATASPAGKLGDGQIHILPVQGNISLLVNAGGNITVQAGDDGILLVDAGVASMSDKVLEAIKPLSKKPLAYIVNTDDREDHVGGNANVSRGGRPVPNANAAGQYRNGGERVANAYIIAFQTILDRMTAANMPEDAWPNDAYSAPQKSLLFNNEAVIIFHQPSTIDGSSFVFFRRSDVISAGDIFDPTQYPLIDVKKGGSIQGVLQGLNRMKLLMVPADRRNSQQGGTLIIPGHGRLSTYADLAHYLEMVTILRDRIQYLIKKGMTLEQVKAAKPTQDYDPVYGHPTGNWTTDMFVEAVYQSLTKPPATGVSQVIN
jgi:glyoxylase-like metal-dependent hydrolase (beta-lactamase superfamily II)